MKIFISWSGTKSHNVARILRDWIPKVMQYISPYVSSEDIRKGKRWLISIASELEGSDFGIICLTKSNTDAAWLNFEAGALSKATQSSGVWTFLLGVKPSDVHGPLAQFQHTVFRRDDVLKLLKHINEHGPEERKLTEASLETSFKQCWTELNQRLKKVLEEPEPRPSPLGHSLEKHLWLGKWSYGTEECSDLLKLEQVDNTGGIIHGRRTAKTGIYLHNYDISGYLLGERMFLTALHTQKPIAVALVLKGDKFAGKLEGLAIRPAGNAQPDREMEDALFHQLDFWAGRAIYEPVTDPDTQVDPTLWSEWKKRDV